MDLRNAFHILSQKSNKGINRQVMNFEPIVLLSDIEIKKMRKVGKLAAELLIHLEDLVIPGISTQEINDAAEKWTCAHGAKSAPLNYAPNGFNPFPKSICTSINHVVCHGIPSEKQILKDGDIINIDVTIILDGYHGDTSKTFFVGTPARETRKLVSAAQECLRRAILEVAPGKYLGDIGATIEEYVRDFGFSVVREFVGHGIGKKFHCPPQIFHFGTRGSGLKMKAGMAFTIEPMINQGTWKTEILNDGWTVVTLDRMLSAQFEHTVLVTDSGVEILTL